MPFLLLTTPLPLGKSLSHLQRVPWRQPATLIPFLPEATLLIFQETLGSPLLGHEAGVVRAVSALGLGLGLGHRTWAWQARVRCSSLELQ